jgi:hypothetical protein
MWRALLQLVNLWCGQFPVKWLCPGPDEIRTTGTWSNSPERKFADFQDLGVSTWYIPEQVVSYKSLCYACRKRRESGFLASRDGRRQYGQIVGARALVAHVVVYLCVLISRDGRRGFQARWIDQGFWTEVFPVLGKSNTQVPKHMLLQS